MLLMVAMVLYECAVFLSLGFLASKVPKDLDAIIIGSGVGGLGLAVLLARVGKKVLVLEQHDRAGGCCHTFTEKGFEFDVGEKDGSCFFLGIRETLGHIKTVPVCVSLDIFLWSRLMRWEYFTARHWLHTCNSDASLRDPLHRWPATTQAVPLHVGPNNQRAAAVGASGQSLRPRSAWTSRKPAPLSHLQRQEPLPRGAEEVLPWRGEGHRWIHEAGQGGVFLWLGGLKYQDKIIWNNNLFFSDNLANHFCSCKLPSPPVNCVFINCTLAQRRFTIQTSGGVVTDSVQGSVNQRLEKLARPPISWHIT